MNNWMGLLVAAFLGLMAMVLNYYYIAQKTRGVETVQLLGIRSDATIAPGDLLTENHFAPVPLPKIQADRLADFVFRYDERRTVAGIRATREFHGGDLVHREDYRTPARELRLDMARNERLITIPVDSRSFIPALVDPGDLISFSVPAFAVQAAGAVDETAPRNPISVDDVQLIGPFKVGSVGNRLGSFEVARANRMPQVQDHVIGIIVTQEGEQLDARSRRLMTALQRANYRNIGVVIHPKDAR